MQWRSTAAVFALLLKRSRTNRQPWMRPRSSSFYQDTILGWSDAELMGNFCASWPTFLYFVSELRPTLERQEFLCSCIPVDSHTAIMLWKLGMNVECRNISHLFGFGLCTVCVLVYLPNAYRKQHTIYNRWVSSLLAVSTMCWINWWQPYFYTHSYIEF